MSPPISQRGTKYMAGIQTPYLYIGMAMTSFAFHLEDGDLCSINYNHAGEPIVWYVVPDLHGNKLEELVAESTSSLCDKCIRHKNIMVPSGFNCGLNYAEAINFATTK